MLWLLRLVSGGRCHQEGRSDLHGTSCNKLAVRELRVFEKAAMHQDTQVRPLHVDRFELLHLAPRTVWIDPQYVAADRTSPTSDHDTSCLSLVDLA